MNIVAFLQNPWFKEGTAERYIHMYRDDQLFHRRALAMSMSGKRLVTAFGELYDRIHWDNTNWRPAWYAAGIEAPDFSHITRVLHMLPRWDAVLLFGRQAEDSVTGAIEQMPNGDREWADKFIIHTCHHPNARHKTQEHLNAFGTRIMAQNIVITSGRNELKWGFLTAKEAGFPLGSFGADGIRPTDHKFWASMKINGAQYDFSTWIRGELPTNRSLDQQIQHAINKMEYRASRGPVVGTSPHTICNDETK